MRWGVAAGGLRFVSPPAGPGVGGRGRAGGGAGPAPAGAVQKGSGGQRSSVCRRAGPGRAGPAGQGAAGGAPVPSAAPSRRGPQPSRPVLPPGPCGGRCAVAELCSSGSLWGRCSPSPTPRAPSILPPLPCPTAAGTASTRPVPARSSAPASPWASTSKRLSARPRPRPRSPSRGHRETLPPGIGPWVPLRGVPDTASRRASLTGHRPWAPATSHKSGLSGQCPWGTGCRRHPLVGTSSSLNNHGHHLPVVGPRASFAGHLSPGYLPWASLAPHQLPGTDQGLASRADQGCPHVLGHPLCSEQGWGGRSVWQGAGAVFPGGSRLGGV